MRDGELRKHIAKAFRMRGLSLKADAAKLLMGVIKHEGASVAIQDVNNVLETLVEAVKEEKLDSAFVPAACIERVLEKLTSNEEEELPVFDLVDAFAMPRHVFNLTRKAYTNEPPKGKLGSPMSTPAMFRERHMMLLQRIKRNPLFSRPVVALSRGADSVYCKITPVEALIGITEPACVFGMLSQLVEGELHLEDLNGSVKLDVSRARTTVGMFTEGCFVLAEGVYENNVFHVSVLGFPPTEARAATLAVHPALDALRLAALTDTQREGLLELEGSNDSLLILVSDVYLDRPPVLRALRTLLQGYEAIGPEVIVLMGNFTSREYGQGEGEIAELRQMWEDLAELIAAHPTICAHTRFVFVPGPSDIGITGIMPRGALPRSFVRPVLDKVANVTFMSNPCRMRWCSQEIVLSRYDILHRMRRHCVLPLASEGEHDVSEHLVKTLLDQAHLMPLPLTSQPVYHNYDAALWLYPLPDVLVLGDRCDQFESTYENCLCFNPGSFPVDLSFVVYRPRVREAEYSRIM